MLSSQLAKHAIASVKLTGKSYPNINHSTAIRHHASTSHLILSMLIETFMSPISTHHAFNFSWRLRRKTPMASPLMAKGHGNSDNSKRHTNPHFFSFLRQKNTAAKRDLGVANQGEIHMCINNSMNLPSCPLAALRRSLIPLFSRLRGFPLLTATWMDGLDGLSIVCPSPRYRNFSTGFRYTR